MFTNYFIDEATIFVCLASFVIWQLCVCVMFGVYKGTSSYQKFPHIYNLLSVLRREVRVIILMGCVISSPFNSECEEENKWEGRRKKNKEGWIDGWWEGGRQSEEDV